MLRAEISDLSTDNPVWRSAQPDTRARKNDIHIPLSFDWAQHLLEGYPDADRDFCSLAILLHDIGWHSIDMGAIIDQGFRSDDFLQSDVRYLHESESVRLGTLILREHHWGDEVISQVNEIIAGHDTRRDSNDFNYRIVCDTDKLWCFEDTGIAVASDWFGVTPRACADRLGPIKAGHKCSERSHIQNLATNRQQSKLHVI